MKLPDREPEDALRELERAVLGAGRPVRRIFESGSFDVRLKSDFSLLTEADTEAERVVREALSERFPGIDVASEEDKEKRRLSASEDFFLIDPIDGTWNFAAGIPVFFISVAFLHRGAPRMGVLYNPVSGQLLSAREGGGAMAAKVPHRQDSPAPRLRDRQPIHSAPYHPLSECQIHRHDRRLDANTAIRILERVVLRSRGVRDLGSTTAELALIACGVSDALVGYYVANWDVAAAGLILTEAGGVLTKLDGNPVVYTGADKFSICAAGSSRLHTEIVRSLQDDMTGSARVMPAGPR